MIVRSNGCWHCGEPLPASGVVHARIAGEPRAMCCAGCRAAAEWIEQLGLNDYYRLRTQPAHKADAASVSLDAWRRPEIARYVVRDLGDGDREAMLLVDGVHCAACVWLIERALAAVPGVSSVQVNAVAQRARVTWREPVTALPRILEQLGRTGYRALPLDARALDDARRRESRDALKRLVVAGFGAMQAMMYAAVLYVGAGSTDRSADELFRWLGFLVATPVVCYSARPFFAGALRSLKARQLGMDVPIAAAVALIYAGSLIEALRGGGHVYFDSVSMFVFFLLTGRYLEMRARHRAGDLTDALSQLTPPFADRRRGDGVLERIGVHELTVGDCVHITDGGLVPTDGVLLSERCRIDEALLSGESMPVARCRGDPLIGGSVLIDGPVDMRVERVGPDTALSAIAALVARAQAQRPRLARAGERAAGRLVARVLALTVLTVVAWSFFDPERAFSAAVAVLVVSCPCAFALAVPAAFTRALAVLARRGVLVVNPDAIQGLADATHIVFDKTGTLTEPQLVLADVETFRGWSRDAALRLAASLARQSRHPVARTLVAAQGDCPLEAAVDVSSHAGLGLRGNVAGREVRLGRPEFSAGGWRPGAGGGAAQRAPSGDGQRTAQHSQLTAASIDAVVLADDGGPIAAFHLTERLRSGTRAAIDALKACGMEVFIASGDAALKVADVAARLDIAEWRARQLPSDKLEWLRGLRQHGACVIAVGDGVNDAPVLAGADVAIALAGGAQIAQASSDIVLAGERIAGLATARAIARQTLSILRQNQRWALTYNLAAVPLAALGFVPPWLAALGMSFSSLVVILNALRIGRDVPAGASKRAQGEEAPERVGAA
jgi:Cu2+-exporting ATPase